MKWLEEILQNAGVDKVEEITEAIKAELPKHFKPSDEFNARGTEIESLKEQLAQRDKDIKELKKNSNSEELSQQLSALQKKYDDETKSLSAQMEDLKVTNAIKLALTKDSKDVDIVAGLIDKTKLKLTDEGVEGLQEQIDSLKTSKSFLFNEDKSSYGEPFGGTSPNANNTNGFDFNFNKINNYGGK